jgi:hypothetical protein
MEAPAPDTLQYVAVMYYSRDCYSDTDVLFRIFCMVIQSLFPTHLSEYRLTLFSPCLNDAKEILIPTGERDSVTIFFYSTEINSQMIHDCMKLTTQDLL